MSHWKETQNSIHQQEASIHVMIFVGSEEQQSGEMPEIITPHGIRKYARNPQPPKYKAKT